MTGAVFSSVAFLEAAINELFDDVADDHKPYVGPLPEDTKLLLAGLWAFESVERWAI